MIFWLTDTVVIGLMSGAAVIDIKTKRIPDLLNLLIFLSGACMLSFRDNVLDHIEAMMVMPLVMIFANLIFKTAFGGGDIKLIAGAGLVFGSEITGGAVLLGIIFSGVFGAVLLITGKKKRKDYFALGPFLTAGFVVRLLYVRNEVFTEMELYQIVGIGLIVVGIAVLIWYFHDKKKHKDDDEYVDRLKIK